MPLTNQGIYHFGEFQLNLDMRTLARQGERVPVGSRAFDVLACLVAHAGTVVTKAELLEAVWTDSFVEEGTLSQHIFSLRKALGEEAACIATIQGRGYRFMGAVRHTLPATSTPPPDPKDSLLFEARESVHMVIEEPMASRSAVPASRRIWRYGLTVAGAAAVLGVAGWMRPVSPAPRAYLGVVLADFTNTTGDAAFDHTLKRALEIDLEQSPYMDVLNETDRASTLQLMGLKSDAALTGDVAHEMCVRTNRQIVLLGNIASVGGQYLVSVQASDCNTGKSLASAKTQASGKDKVLSALDSVADRVRGKLGESSKSISGYQVPIEQATTSSLEALRAYSIGNSIVAQGRPATESLPFFRRAVELDPQFAMAYDGLGSSYFHLNEFTRSLQNFQKAMDLSNRVSERERLILRAHYYGEGYENVQLALQTYQLWAATYPYDSRPVVSLISLYTDMGHPLDGIPYGERALALQPENGLLYQALVRACTHAGRFDEAKSLGAQAAKLGKDNSHIHASLWQVAYAEHNAGDLERETQWAHSHADGWYGWFFPDLEATAEGSEGRFRDSEKTYAQSVAVAKREGLEDLADHLLVDQAFTEGELGELAKLRATLQRIRDPNPDVILIARLRVALGDVAYAEKVLASESGKPNRGFLGATVDLPCLRATIALARRRPLEAISALEASLPYDQTDYSLAFLRGQAYLDLARPEQALAEYRKIVGNPGVDPASPQAPLAHLGMARAYALQGDHVASRTEYEHFLANGKNSDPDAHIFTVAKAELAKIR